MRLLLAGMTLACIGQVAQANPYVDSPQGSPPAATEASQNEPEASAPGGEPAAPASDGAASPAEIKNLFDTTPAPTAAAPAPAANVAQPPVTPPASADATQRSLLVSGPKPTKLMQDLMKAPAGAPLAGTPVTLGETVRDSRSREDQTQRARAYWDLAAAVADYYLSVLEAQELETLRAGVTAPGKQWDARQADLATRIDAARYAAQAAQLQLHALLGGGAGASLPIPADIPHCGRYNAEYDEIFATRPDPVAKKLADVLSLRHTELRGMTQAIDDAKAYLNQVSATRSPASDGTELLNAQQLLSLQRRAFVARAREYNQEIAAYTELAAPADVAADRLVAMMIRISTTTDQMRWGQSGIEPATAEVPADSTGVADSAPTAGKGVPPTFAERHQEVRRPLQRILGRDREKSIVVSRLRNLMTRDQ